MNTLKKFKQNTNVIFITRKNEFSEYTLDERSLCLVFYVFHHVFINTYMYPKFLTFFQCVKI